jgi:hypothetical protein
MKSRFDFINQILIEELYVKRLPALTSFKEGLDHFGLLKFLEMNPDIWRPFLWKMEDSMMLLQPKRFCLWSIPSHRLTKKRELTPQPRSQGFSVRTRRDTRKPWSGPVNFAF